jgi:AAA ATPase domain/Adenylate and Guanylate cyclase catalytic domain
VEKFIGDAVMAVYGMPQAREDDALRAVRAAGALREAMAELNRELARELEVALPVRTGVNTGLVLAGDEREGHAFVAGDTVNVAARLEQAAGPGEVLLGEPTYRLVADAVRVEPIAPFVPAGKTAPIPAYRLLEVAPGAPGRARRLDAPLVGRAAELAVLERALELAATRRSCELVTVLGDAGVGKSRLLCAFADRVGDRAVVLRARCSSDPGAAGDELVGELLAQAAASRPGSVAERPAGLADEPRAIFRAVRRQLEALAGERPVVVLVDDLHWAEPLLLDLVGYLHACSLQASLLLVVAARRQLLERQPCWTAGVAGATLALEPLAAAEAAELAASLPGPAGLDAGMRQQIAAWAEGNPLFVEELLRWLADGDERGPLAGLPAPPAVRAVVEAELDRLPPEERTVLELASVVGREFEWAAVEALAPAWLRPRVGTVLLALTRRNLIRVAARQRGEDAFAFRHHLLRDAAYQAVPKRERALLHVRVAERLDGASQDDEAVVGHLGQAYRYLAQLAGEEQPPPAAAARRAARVASEVAACR